MKKFIKVLSTALLVLMTCVMFACVPSNVDKAKTKMEKAGYTVEAAADEAEDAEGCVGGIVAIKSDGGLLGALKGESLIALLFDSKDSAEAYLDEAEDLFKLVYGTVHQDGKWIYAGSEAAIEAFEK